MNNSETRAHYHSITGEQFPPKMELTFVHSDGRRETIHFEKTTWKVGDDARGLRYGENPDQPAALYHPTNPEEFDCVALQDGTTAGRIAPLTSKVELVKAGKHPGKINITDVDSGINILRYLDATPTSVILKHNNPCGVARGTSLSDSFKRAVMADRIASFGGTLVVNRELTPSTAEMVAEHYLEVIAAPEFAPGTMKVLEKAKNLRVVKVANIANIGNYGESRNLEVTSLIDGGMILQLSQIPLRKPSQFTLAETSHRGDHHRILRSPSALEMEDLLFGWLVCRGIYSNSIVYVRDGVSVGIGAGEQDRVGVARIARDKAYRNTRERLSFEHYNSPYQKLPAGEQQDNIDRKVRECCGGLKGAAMVSDGFFPFRDGIDVGLSEGVTAVIQPGGSIRDYEVIEACNEAGATMLFTGQRIFKH